MSRRALIADTLAAHLSPDHLEVIDESHLHAGHAGARAEGETHYRVRIVAAAFTGRSRVERHRLVLDLLAAPFRDGLHALALEARAPGDLPARPADVTVR